MQMYALWKNMTIDFRLFFSTLRPSETPEPERVWGKKISEIITVIIITERPKSIKTLVWVVCGICCSLVLTSSPSPPIRQTQKVLLFPLISLIDLLPLPACLDSLRRANPGEPVLNRRDTVRERESRVVRLWGFWHQFQASNRNHTCRLLGWDFLVETCFSLIGSAGLCWVSPTRFCSSVPLLKREKPPGSFSSLKWSSSAARVFTALHWASTRQRRR